MPPPLADRYSTGDQIRVPPATSAQPGSLLPIIDVTVNRFAAATGRGSPKARPICMRRCDGIIMCICTYSRALMDMNSHRALITILKLAYSGERAAAHAYRGHANAVRDPGERDRIRTIEEEEWHHRMLVGKMLEAMGERPDAWRELRSAIIGRTLSLLCHFSGWFIPMYAAGRLESRNIKEYEAAARHARDSGHQEFIEDLLVMAEVEWDHEAYFRSRVQSHPWVRWFHLWPSPPLKESIRSSFAEESGSLARIKSS